MPKVNVRTRPETGALYFDFFYRGIRCREQTALADTPENRKRVEALAKRIQKDMANGTFDYATYFPNSPRVDQFAAKDSDDLAPGTFNSILKQAKLKGH